MIEVGYKVKFINHCYVYENKSKIGNSPFKYYIEKFFMLKQQAEKEGNAVKRNIAKLLMNSLYGKMLQGMCDESSSFFNENEYKEFLEWYNDNEMTSWRGFDNGLFV